MKLRHYTLPLLCLLTTACGDSGFVEPPANLPPRLSAIADQAAPANETSAMAFTVDDEQPSSLSVDVSSDNQSLVPDASLAVSGYDSARTLSVTPVADALGDAFITIVVTDTDGLKAGTSFLLTIAPRQTSMQQFARSSFDVDADDEPELVNALEFMQDADDDDFADLLAE